MGISSRTKRILFVFVAAVLLAATLHVSFHSADHDANRCVACTLVAATLGVILWAALLRPLSESIGGTVSHVPSIPFQLRLLSRMRWRGPPLLS